MRTTIMAALGAALACMSGMSAAAAPLQHRSASMQCLDRRVAVDADCFTDGGARMMCTRQALRFFDARGQALEARVFAPEPKQKGDDYPLVEARFGALSCVDTAAGDKLVLARMDNGGNCEQCEWVDVYALDGKLLGSTRAGGKRKAIAYPKTRRVLTEQSLAGMYMAKAVAPVAAQACPVKLPIGKSSFADDTKVFEALTKAFDGAIGPDAHRLYEDKVMAKLAASHLDEDRMAVLAAASACAALLDEHASCAQYYDPEYGNPLGVFMSMKKSAPVRRQFEAAVARVPDPNQRRAAQYCIKLVGAK